LRWVIFIILFLGIGWPVWTASQDLPLPGLTPEVEAASELIDQISSGAPVLVAVDYQPGLSPELDATAGVVIDHLMLKGAYLALVSTSPTGPVQAERLVNQVNRYGGHQYTDFNQYTNLGFIPGGTAGLLGLAEAPRRILPFGMAGNFAWQAAALQPIEQLNQFALVAVLTEDPETARAWVEQVSSFLGQTPLLMVVSAQAEPVVRPYYESRPQQVQGLVSGLAGGAAYENLQARPGLARKYWDAFGLGLVLAAALIIIGGIASAISSLLANRKPVKGEKAA
jgi:hypothetical protein